jgi:hypothetical protein
MRRVVGVRSKRVGILIDLSNQIGSTLKTLGLRAVGGASGMKGRSSHIPHPSDRFA